MVNLDVDTLPTMPAAPPAAGADRALDPTSPDPAMPLLGTRRPDDVVGDVARATESPITAQTSTPATIHPPLLFDSDRPDAALDAGRAGRVWWGLVGS
jgi:hypothetical protein